MHSNHHSAIFKNSCLNVPLDPSNKLPLAHFERKTGDSRTMVNDKKKFMAENFEDIEDHSVPFKDFYRSIPDYEEVGHLSSEDFYRRLKNLRNRREMLFEDYKNKLFEKDYCLSKHNSEGDSIDNIRSGKTSNRHSEKEIDSGKSLNAEEKFKDLFDHSVNVKSLSKHKTDLNKSDIDFHDNKLRKFYSLPATPTKAPKVKHKIINEETDNKVFDELQRYTKSLESRFLRKKKKRSFSANPVPIESRIPLYDKILEDQQLSRRSIAKIQSTIELQNKMKPFEFTKRDEKRKENDNCVRHRLCCSNFNLNLVDDDCSVNDSKQFKAKPVSKKLLSDFANNRYKDDEYFRALRRRIRAEEMLKLASLPPSMAKREEAAQSNRTQEDVQLPERKKKGYRNTKEKPSKCDGIALEEISSNMSSEHNHNTDVKRIYGRSKSNTPSSSNKFYNTVSTPSSVNTNKTNLAALLRMEATKRKFELNALRQLEEERFKSEIKWRDSILRRNPAWDTIKYNHARELAMRLETRREEERLRREKFLNEMELMYAKVHQQPLMFERNYGPANNKQRRSRSRNRSRSAFSTKQTTFSPLQRKAVSINDQAETILSDDDDDDHEDDDNSSPAPEESIQED